MCGPQPCRYRLYPPQNATHPKLRGTPILDKKILVIIPCYNEEDNIVNTVENLRAVCPEVDYLVVNDCSTDRSAEILKEHHYPFLDLPVNLGIGGNVQCGYLYAVHHGYDVAVQMDGDGQHDPAYLRALVPCLPRPDAPPLLHEMAVAAATAGIGPMSAVAGAFARETGRMLRREFGVGEVVVENGGDIYADVHRPLDVALFAGESPLSERVGLHIPGGAFPLGICTSSGTVGPSLSFGRADAVMIVCRDVLLADSYATAWANRVRTEEDTGFVVERACRVPEILGAMAVKGERLAVGGTFELRLFGEARDF